MEYIEVGQQGEPIGNPVLEENLRYVFPDIDITPETMFGHGYRPILENKPTLTTKQIVQKNGFTKQDNDFVWNWKITTLDQEHFTNYLIRYRRDAELRDTDWTQVSDAPLTAQQKQQWAQYRQSLRDLTSLYPEVDETTQIEWPQRPNKATQVESP